MNSICVGKLSRVVECDSRNIIDVPGLTTGISPLIVQSLIVRYLPAYGVDGMDLSFVVQHPVRSHCYLIDP